MITPAYVQTMARYNTWQNKALMAIVDVMDQAELDLDRGAFFGSIQRTLSHLLWGDMLWMGRFDGGAGVPADTTGDTASSWETKTEWATDRFVCDARIRKWADGLRQIDLNGDLTWPDSHTGENVSRPWGLAITHFFNHQTHHRGQVHAMLTAAGQDAPVSDLLYMPKDL